MTEPQPSPTPWKLRPCTTAGCGWPEIDAADGTGVIVSHRLMSEKISDADADLIVKAVNNYRNLISIAYRVGLTKCSCPMLRNCIHNAAKTAWKKAEGIEDETLDLQGD